MTSSESPSSINKDQIILPNVRRPPHKERFDDPKNLQQNRVVSSSTQIPAGIERQLQKMLAHLQNPPALIAVSGHLTRLIAEEYEAGRDTIDGKENFIIEFCTREVLAIMNAKREIAEYLMANKDEIHEFREYRRQARIMEEQYNVTPRQNLFTPSPSGSSAFQAPNGPIRPLPLHPIYQDNDYLQYLRDSQMDSTQYMATPLSSPVPKKTTPGGTPELSTAPGSAFHSLKLLAPTEAPEAPESPDSLQKKVEENVASIKATMAKPSAASTVTTTVTAAGGATVSATVIAAAGGGATVTPAEEKSTNKRNEQRRNKQLDDATSADSESDDDDDEGKKKPKKQQGTTRRAVQKRAAAPGTRRVAKQAPGTSEVVAEASEDVPEGSGALGPSSKTTPKSRKEPTVPRTPRDAVPGPSISRRRKLADDDASAAGDDDGATPQRKQRRTAAATTSRKTPVEKKEESDKEKCGVAKTHCLCKKWEKKKELQWVMCQRCDQWYHAYCILLTNTRYGADAIFECCGDNANPEAKRCIDGLVAADYKGMRVKPPILSP